MIEDFNAAPILLEDKQSIIDILDDSSLKIEQVECGICQQKFTNENSKNQILIVPHLKEFNHNSLKIINKNNPSNKEEIKCCICQEKNIFKLVILIKKNKDKEVIDLKNIIFCKTHAPKDYIQPILNILELEEIINRKLNKVKLSYETKNEYYEIYKPLLIADMLYTRKAYDSKLEFDIELIEAKGERYYFEISDNFNQINFSPGRVLKFTEDKYQSEEESEEEPFQFLGVIVNTTNVENNKKDENFYNIWIIPINRHITTLKGHAGQYKIKEEFCTIPYQRMLEALDAFTNDISDEENEIFGRVISLYLTRRIMGHFPTKDQIKNDKDGKIHEMKEEYLRIENNSLKKVLFEENIISKLESSKEGYGELNKSQISILQKVFSNVLNLIQGPPGTGKTFLSSFIAYNIFKFRKDKKEKILLCSPSNSAADNLASNLIKLNNVIGGKMKIMRIYAKSREFLEIPESIQKISLHNLLKVKLDKENIVMTTKDILTENIEKIVEEIDIVISTCSTSWDERIMHFSFPFVIIDEVTQCCEIESLISIAHGCKHLTLIGDQKQLGPVIMHPKANQTGMNISIFERLLKLYPNLLNMLTIQYRMHPEIVKFPSYLFYHNKILNDDSINERIKNEKLDFNKIFKLPGNGKPLFFIHNEGLETLIESGTSKINEEEVDLVVLVLEKLIKSGVDFEDIGIITPYTAQKELIVEKMKEKYKNSEKLKISSVDGFQGGEKDFIILSNVRSNENDQIGFLKNFRRLNVSITRAKKGLIIIGNAKCLYNNKCGWKNLINYYQDNKLIFVPEIKIKENGKKEFIIDKLEYKKIGNDKNVDWKDIYKEYDFDGSGNLPGINEDLLDNFECSENVYLQGNKRHLNKKKKKKNKNKNKKYKGK